MEKPTDTDIRIANMLGNFFRAYSYFELDEENGIHKVVIFKDKDLEELPFDENGEIDFEAMEELMPRAILPILN